MKILLYFVKKIVFSLVSMDITLRVVFVRENTRLKGLSGLYRRLLLLSRKFKNVPSISKPAQVPLGKAWSIPLKLNLNHWKLNAWEK